jgi:hypothetical protein
MMRRSSLRKAELWLLVPLSMSASATMCALRFGWRGRLPQKQPRSDPTRGPSPLRCSGRRSVPYELSHQLIQHRINAVMRAFLGN